VEEKFYLLVADYSALNETYF